MPLAPGTILGVYQVIGSLGAGGMGEVYRARDTKLNRDVALKVLPHAFSNDGDRVARINREAQVLASLNHPNIAAIYGSEGHALVMELIEGEDLADVIARGAMPLSEVLPIAKQLADALEAAHEQGIVHRDLKPANIKLRANGSVKILDFGLAKALGPDAASAADPMNSPTLAAGATQMGMIIGTAAYMAPEQARGKAVDRRADIWAFGVVLYEMLTGQRAFEGDDVSITLASVLKEEPKWQSLPPGLPPPITRLLRRCLEKDPRRRLSAIGDARLELEEQEASVASAPLPVIAATRRPSMVSRLWPALAAAVVTAVVAYTAWASTGGAAPAGVSRLSILPPSGERLYPDSGAVALSPDGTMVAFVVGVVARSDTQLWVRSLDSLTARRLEDADDGRLPFWSPDSRRIGFFTRNKLKTISAAGGRADTLADAPSGRGGAWGTSNVIVFAPDAGGSLYRVPANGGKVEPATTIDPARKEFSHRFPTFLPDGMHFLYASLPGKDGRFDIFAGSLNDTSRAPIATLEAAPAFASPGWLLYGRQGVLAALPFDARSLKVTGDPVTLEDEPSTILDPANSFTAGHSISASSNGSLAYYAAPSLNTSATWYDQNGQATGTLLMPPGHYEALSISHDGIHAAIVKSSSPSESSIWLVDLVRGGASPLSSGQGRNDAPIWSPDGARLVWAADRSGPQNVFVKDVNDAAPERQLYASDVLFKNPVDWSRDGRWIVLSQLDQGTSQNIWLLDASGTKPPTIVIRGPAQDLGGLISPDQRWIAYTADDSGRLELYVQSFPTAGRKVQISDQGAVASWWTPDTRQLIFLGDDLRSLWRVDVQSGPALSAGSPRKFATLPADIIAVDATPDRQRFLALAPERSGSGSLTVVQNWRSALAAKR